MRVLSEVSSLCSYSSVPKLSSHDDICVYTVDTKTLLPPRHTSESMDNQRRDTRRPFRIVFLPGTSDITVNENGVPEITVYYPSITHPATFSRDRVTLEFVNANETTIRNALIQFISHHIRGVCLPKDVEPILNLAMAGFRQVQGVGGPLNDQ